jgi:hypothetical protein
MKFLIYELFSGVGFCNQLFSLETAIYLAHITKRKLILIIKSPLCHCGRVSWDYGKFLDFFSDDYKEFLPYGLEVYYKIIPNNIKSIITTNDNEKIFKFQHKFSNNVFVQANYSDNKDLIFFCNGRQKFIFDFDTVKTEYLYINKSNASRCFYNFYTSNNRYQLMSNICLSLTHLNIKTYTYNKFDLSIHLRLGDYHKSKNDIDKNSMRNITKLNKTIDSLNVNNILIMCDRKDGGIINSLKNKYTVTFTDDLIDKSDNPVIDFLLEKNLCECSKYFIGTQGSTVSNYINYKFYVSNKICNMYTNKTLINSINNNYSWCLNNTCGHSISWTTFWEDNVYKVNMLTNSKQITSINSSYINLVREININPSKNKKIISFCLYGLNDERNRKRNFDKGVYVNYYYMKNNNYKDWIMRVYMPYNEPISYIEKLKEFGDIEIVLVDTNVCLRSLRFLPNDDPNVKVWLSRDLDSIINTREEKAVADWLDNKNDKELMIMSDYQQHTWTIAGGMFGKINNPDNNSIGSFIVNYSDKNSNNINKFANDCEIAEEGLYNDTNYIQYYRAGKKLENNVPFPDLSRIHCNFVGNISPILKYYTDLQLEKKYLFLSNKTELSKTDKFLYNPWKCFFNNSEPLCSMIWKGDDFIMTVDPKKETGNGTWKTLNGNGKKLLEINTHVQILWEEKTYMDAYMPNKEIISVNHGNNKWYNFIKDTHNSYSLNNTVLINSNSNTNKIINNKVYQKKLFNMDLHTSVIEEVIDVFKYLNDDIDVTQWSMSGHHWVFNKQKYNLKYINSTTWENMDMDMIDNFCNEYNEELLKYDGFIVTHSPVFCLLYERYKKPIFLINSCRYVLPYCWKRNDEMMNVLNMKLLEMYNNKQLFVVSNNIGDRDFLKLGTTINSHYAPSLCLYTKEKYTGINDKFLLLGNNSLIKESDLIIHKKHALSNRYSWSDLYKYKGLIILPYEISTMSLFEYYSANIPLLFPSKVFLKQLIKSGKISLGSRYFKYKDYPKTLEDPLGTKYVDWWIDRADFYNDMKHIVFYNNFEELPEILTKLNVKDISLKMVFWNNIRQLTTKCTYSNFITDNLKLTSNINRLTFNKIVPISIIIPTYPPHFHKIDNLICNIIGQTSYPEEVIICASQCSEEKGKMLKNTLISTYKPLFNIIVSTTVEKNNPAENRNRGITMSNNKYIMNLDCDDFFHCRKIEIMYYLIENNPNVDLICHNYILDNIPCSETLNFNIDINNLKTYNDVEKYKLATQNMIKNKPTCTNMVIENKWIHHAHIVFNKNTGIMFNETKGYFKREDGKFCQEYLFNGKNILYLDEKLTLYNPKEL